MIYRKDNYKPKTAKSRSAVEVPAACFLETFRDSRFVICTSIEIAPRWGFLDEQVGSPVTTHHQPIPSKRNSAQSCSSFIAAILNIKLLQEHL